jgi:hypothetical protein
MTAKKIRELKIKICRDCGKEFSTIYDGKKSCSKQCTDAAYAERHRAKRNEQSKLAMRRKRIENPSAVKSARDKHREKPESRVHAAEKSRNWHKQNRKYANEGRAIRFEKARHETPWRHLFVSVKGRAKARGIPFTLTREHLRELWTGRCELTGLKFVISPSLHGPHPYAASLDKIVPKLGYVEGNVRFILQCLNLFKYTGTDEQMYLVAAALLKNRISITKKSRRRASIKQQEILPLQSSVFTQGNPNGLAIAG